MSGPVSTSRILATAGHTFCHSNTSPLVILNASFTLLTPDCRIDTSCRRHIRLAFLAWFKVLRTGLRAETAYMLLWCNHHLNPSINAFQPVHPCSSTARHRALPNGAATRNRDGHPY